MPEANTIYEPPPIAEAFIRRHLKKELFYDWIVGPFGSAKTTASFFKLVYMASLQAPSPDGIRYSRCVIVRNTAPQLRDNTLTSWNRWFQDGVYGEWKATEKDFILRFADVECRVMFRPLDTPADVARALGLEVTFAIIDEFVEIPQAIVEGLSGRLGRWIAPGDVKPSNWGMWGASNPGTEDIWWYDYLHSKVDPETGERVGCVQVKYATDIEKQKAFQLATGYAPDDKTGVDADGNTYHINNAWYYHQPSGFHADAENIENLPGKRGYYTNLAKGKSKDWIKQFIEAEWGFSIAGTPVISSFSAERHIAKSELRYNPRLRLVIGVDPGLGGSAFIFMQQGLDGRLYILGELVQRGIGVERLLKERLGPYLRERFPGARVILAPDPAAAIRSGNDEKTAIRIMKSPPYNYTVWNESNNRLPLRINAIDHYCNGLVLGESALQIDPVHCPILIRALKGGWRYAVEVKRDQIKGNDPEKNQWSHPGDACGYGCRFFHKGVVDQDNARANPLPRLVYGASEYHAR